MAQDLIDRYPGPTTELGCWQSKLGRDCRVVLKKLPVRPWMKQVALIATNGIDELKKTLGKRSYGAVTQLCHNYRCINPEHIIVESKSNNLKRKACKGKAVVVRDGVTDHPCPHGSVEKMRQCILPVEHGQDAVGTVRSQMHQQNKLQLQIWMMKRQKTLMLLRTSSTRLRP
ncbi:zinc-binding loop region of homing endonuclease-domain-containing protein [Lipomyces tetrasporus]